MEKKTIVIAMASRNPGLADVLEQEYGGRGCEVVRSDAKSLEEVSAFYEGLEKKGTLVEACIYVPLALQEVSLFDGDFMEKLAVSMEEGLANGTWWVQQTCAYLKRTGQRGSVVILDHVPSVVPDMKYSYCCIPEAALANLGRVAVMDTHGNTDVRINLVTCGWQIGDADQDSWRGEMETIYGGAKAPVLAGVSAKEIADTCIAAAELEGMNGNNLFVDGGYSISRTIRRRA